MAFLFLKPKPKSLAETARARSSATASPKVMVGNVGAAVRSTPLPDVDDSSRQAMFKKLRRSPSATEIRVGDAAMTWLLGLPQELRPLQCCKAYPHVVNHLAGWWESPEALASYFDDLLHSHRKQRAGFPAPIKAELLALLAHARGSGLVPLV
jgi:hypothetical protein